MVGFWDKVKKALGIGSAAHDAASSEETQEVDGRGDGASPAPGVAAAEKPMRFKELDKKSLRLEAMKIQPYTTQWIGRVDVIPPTSDDRTALVDRGLVQRGYFTESQIREFHRIGDEYLEYNIGWHRDNKARLAASNNAHQAVEKLRAEREEAKEAIRAEAKRKREARRAEIEERKKNEIFFLGRGVSTRLSSHDTDVSRLENTGLPVLLRPRDLAEAMGLSVSELRWLAFFDESGETMHYSIYEIPKRSGGKRLISAPMARLKAAQRWVLEHVLLPLPISDQAHGFVPGRSTVTNAAPHLGADIVINLDLQDFFPTITFRRVRGFFESLGYSGAVSTTLALLCTEAPRQKVGWGEETYWVALGDPALPQGAPTSPAISNQIACKLDRRLDGMAKQAGWTYTRYADDLTFSAAPGKRGEVGRLISRVRHVVREEGFALNPDKGRIQRAERRQEVTGIVVNDKLSLSRKELRRLRAILHQAKQTGLEAQNLQGHPNFEGYLRGKFAYLAMVDRDKGLAMMRELDRLVL